MNTKFVNYIILLLLSVGLYANSGACSLKISGWSNDGKIIAFEIDYYYSMVPATETKLMVINLVTDEILENILISSEVEDEENKNIDDKYAVVNNIKNKYNLNSIDIPIKRFPVKWKNDEYNAELFLSKNINDMFGEIITEYTLELISEKKGYKIISSANLIAYTMNIVIKGVYIHPTEPRACIILQFDNPGFEGELETEYVIIGAHLDYGFTQGR